MKYYHDSSKTETNFSELKNPITFLNSIREGKLTLEQTQSEKEAFNKYLKSRSEEQRKMLANINMLFNVRNNAAKFLKLVSAIFDKFLFFTI